MNRLSKANFDDFVKHIHLHRSRMLEIAPIVHYHFPEHFSKVNQTQLSDYLQIHDQVKVLSLEQLQGLGYSMQNSFSQRLFEFYGRNAKQLNDLDRLRLQDLIVQLNSFEEAEKQRLSQTQEYSVETLAQMRWLERICDCTDTGLFRQVEFNITETSYNGAQYIASLGDKLGAEVSMWLESYLYSTGWIETNSFFTLSTTDSSGPIDSSFAKSK